MHIHLIEELSQFEKVDKNDKSSNSWESGRWVVGIDMAEKLIGGKIFLHHAQDKPSFYGGLITGYRVETEGESTGRIIFIFNTLLECKGVSTSKKGWGNEKKYCKCDCDCSHECDC